MWGTVESQEWNRGKQIETARQIYEGEKADIGLPEFQVDVQGYKTRQFIGSVVTFYTSELHLREDPAHNKLVRPDLPGDVAATYRHSLLWLELRTWWVARGNNYLQDALTEIHFEQFKKASAILMCCSNWPNGNNLPVGL